MTKGPPGKSTRRARRFFSLEFKQEAVRLLQEQRKLGGSVAKVGRELGVGPELLRRWERELHGTVPLREWSPLQQELKELRRELEITRQERDFLKKAAAYFAKGEP
jgi:Transposase.